MWNYEIQSNLHDCNIMDFSGYFSACFYFGINDNNEQIWCWLLEEIFFFDKYWNIWSKTSYS